MSATTKLPKHLTVAEFLAWPAPAGAKWQLVDGEPQAMAPASRTHGTMLGELARILGNHFEATGSPCGVVIEPGIVPRAFAANNFRIPDLAVTCTGYSAEESVLADPVLIVEILSPSNRAETWASIWAYSSLPSVREILILSSTEIRADLLRRDAHGNWPDMPATLTEGDLTLTSVSLTVPLAALYRTTRLARAAA
jgi:Uma2 family endonuclease